MRRWTCGYCRTKVHTDTDKPPVGWAWVPRLGLRCGDCFRKLCLRRAQGMAQWREQRRTLEGGA